MKRSRFTLRPVFSKHPLFLFHFILLIFALSITLLFFHLFPFPIQRHKIQLQSRPHNKYLIIYYHDLDHDGYSETIYLKNLPLTDEYGVKVVNFQGGIIDQWNFREKWVPGSIFGDYDHDFHDEAYFLTHNRDSLFLYGLDINQKRFFINRQFIEAAPRPNPNPGKVWDVFNFRGTLFDMNGDGYQDLVFTVSTGFALQPRTVYIVDVRKGKLFARSPFIGATLTPPQIFDINQDGLPEVLVGSYASGNYHQPVPYSDNDSWLFLFDHQLNFLFPPIHFHPYYSSVWAYPIRFNNQYYIAALGNYLGTQPFNSILRLIQPDGTIVVERELEKSAQWEIFAAPEGDYSRLYLWNNRKELLRLNRELRPIQHQKLKYNVGSIALQYDLDGDFQPELISKNFLIIEPDFSEMYRLNIPAKTGRLIFQVRKRGDQLPELVITYPDESFYLTYQINPLYRLNVLIFIGVLLFYFAVLETLASIFRKRWMWLQYNRLLLSHTPRGILVLDDKGRICCANELFRQLTGLNCREGQSFETELKELPELVRFIRENLGKQKSVQQEVRYFLKQNEFRGTLFYVPIRFLNSIPAGFYLELCEIKEQEHPEFVRLWSKTVQKMAHDIKTPLSTIQITLKTILFKLEDMSPTLNRTIHPDFLLLENALKKVREMTQNLLKFTHLEQPHFQRCSLREVLEQALQRFSGYFDGKVRLSVELNRRYDIVRADPPQLEMVFQIVIENAIDAMGSQGHLRIRSHLTHSPNTPLKSFVAIDFADTGSGIPESEREKVFEPYYTTRPQRAGMGLTIARKIIRDHGGEISILSHPEFATVVRILLPVILVSENESERN